MADTLPDKATVNNQLGDFFNKKKKKIVNKPPPKTKEELELEKEKEKLEKEKEELLYQKIEKDNETRRIKEEIRQDKFIKKFESLRNDSKEKYTLARLITTFRNEWRSYSAEYSAAQISDQVSGEANGGATYTDPIFFGFKNKRIIRLNNIKKVFNIGELPDDKFIEETLDIKINDDDRD